MQDSKKGFLPFRHGIKLSKEQSPQNEQKEKYMKYIPYASVIGSFMYTMLYMRADICYAIGIVSRYQSNLGPGHWIAVKRIIKYLLRMINYMLIYSGSDLIPIGYIDLDFQSQPQIFCSLLVEETLYGEVSRNLALLILP